MLSSGSSDPPIVRLPACASAPVGGTAKLALELSDAEPYTVQWYKGKLQYLITVLLAWSQDPDQATTISNNSGSEKLEKSDRVKSVKQGNTFKLDFKVISRFAAEDSNFEIYRVSMIRMRAFTLWKWSRRRRQSPNSPPLFSSSKISIDSIDYLIYRTLPPIPFHCTPLPIIINIDVTPTVSPTLPMLLRDLHRPLRALWLRTRSGHLACDHWLDLVRRVPWCSAAIANVACRENA